MLIRLGERSTIEVARANKARGYKPHREAVLAGGGIAEKARLELEALTGEPVASRESFVPKHADPMGIADGSTA